MQVSRSGREVDIACCRSVVKVAIPQRRGSELPMNGDTAERRHVCTSTISAGLGERTADVPADLDIWSPDCCSNDIDWIRSRISDQAAHSGGSGLNVGAIRFDKDGVADRRAVGPIRARPVDHQDPGFSLGMERPVRIRREVDPLEHKMRACDQGRSSRGETSRTGLGLSRPGIGDGDGVVFVQFALPAIVEQTERRVAVLLNLGEHDAGAYGVDGAGRDEDDVAFRDRAPLNEIGNRAVPDRCAQFAAA